MKLFFSILILGFYGQISQINAAEDPLAILDRDSTIERVRKAYGPVSLKLDGEWLVTSASGTETWKFANQKWKCEGSQIPCAEWVPFSFKWFGLGKAWLAQATAVKKESYDFQGSRQSIKRPEVAAVEGVEEPPAEIGVQFEGKRNALEVWEWTSPLTSSLTISLSLRDYLIERIKTNDGIESLEWAQASGAKTLGLHKVFVERGDQRILFVRK